MTGKKLGLVIGNNYPNSNRELNFAVADAIDIKEVLKNKDICGFDNVIPLIDKTSREASIEVEKLLKNAAKDDLIFIYFSGHGRKDFNNDLYLLFNDTVEDAPLATSLTFDFINKCIKYPSRKSVIIVLDCCYSGAAGIKDTGVAKTLTQYSGEGTLILTSTGSTGSATAKEDKEFKHGVFTHYLIEGLEEGFADTTGKGCIYINDLYNYACEKTKESCSQHPEIKGSIQGKIPIGKNPNKIRENEYRAKKVKLIDSDELSGFILNISLNVLKKNYVESSELTSEDKRILKLLDSFLKDELSSGNYETAVLHIKGISKPAVNTGIKKASIPQGSGSSNNFEGSKTFTSFSTGMEFVLIPAGKFMMGSEEYSNEQPVHNVTIEKSFYVGKYPVTQKQWIAVMGKNPSYFQGDDRPVERVSWDDVQKFIEIINKKESTDQYRLLSEAEWEYACRAKTSTRYYFGDDGSKLGEYAWYSANSGGETHQVGQKKPNSWDLYDMYGNVWEWVQDKWHDNYKGAPSDGSVWEDGNGSIRVIRGGGWSYDAWRCRSANRSRYDSGDRYDNVGFRLLRKL